MDNENQDEKISRDKDHSTTIAKDIKCSCQWTIYNFSFFAQGDKSSFAPVYAPDIESPLFKYGCNEDLVWDINIVNLRELDEEYLKIYVYVNDVEWHDYMNIDVKVSILDDKGRKAHTIKYKVGILSTESVNFIKKEYLMNKDNKLLNDDKLVIVCEINAFAEVYTFSWNAEEMEDYEDEDLECTVEMFRSRLKVSQDLKGLMKSNDHNVTVVINKKQFYVHKCMLVARSRVFSAMFEQEMLEKVNNIVTIKDINSHCFENIIKFIYSGTIDNINDISYLLVLEILKAADEYELNQLKEICECKLSSTLNTSNAIKILAIADKFHANKLKKCIMEFIIAHKQEYTNNIEFDSLLSTHSHLLPCFVQVKSEIETSRDNSLDLTDDSDGLDNIQSSCINHIHLQTLKSTLEGNKWSVTQVCNDTSSCIWQIDQIDLFLSKNSGDYIVSDKFSKENIKLSWQLYLYTKGINNDTKDYISLFIQFSDGSHCSHKLQAQYEFAIINGKGETVNRINSDILTFTLNNSKLGETKFIRRDLLLNKRKNLLQDNTLMIVCNIKFGLNSQKRFCQSNELDYCEYKLLLALSDDFERLLESGKCSDITVSVSGKEFQMHRAVLAARSPPLLKIINEAFERQPKQPVELNHVDPVVFKEILLFIYSGKVNSLKELTKSLYAEASRFQLEDLRSNCEVYLCKNLTLENVCDNFVFAHVNNVRKLKAKCSLFITDNLKAVITTSGYRSLAESRPRLLKDLLLSRHNS